MFLLGKTRYVDFKLANSGTPVTGVTISALTVFFVRNGVSCTDTLTLVELGSGRYFIEYTPTAEGHDFIEIDHAASSTVITNSEDIVSTQSILGPSNIVTVTDSYLSGNILKVTQVPDPVNYTLYVYQSSDYESGSTETYDAMTSTQLNSDGSWITTPLYLAPGTYHFVIRNAGGAVMVIAANTQVS